MSSPGPSSPSTPRPSSPSTPGPSTTPNGTRPKSLLDENIYNWTQRSRTAALKKKQEEEKQELCSRIDSFRRLMVGMPEEVLREREQQLQNELNILLHVHQYQEQYPDVAPAVINSIYLCYLELPAEDRPDFAEYLDFKQKLNNLEDTLFKLPPDQFKEVLEDNGGSLAVVYLNLESNPLRVLDGGIEEVEAQQFGQQEELVDLEDEEGGEDEEEEEEDMEEDQEDEEEEMDEEQEDEEDQEMDQDMDQEEAQQIMETIPGEINGTPRDHPVQCEADQHVNQQAQVEKEAVDEEQKERVKRINERIRRDMPTVFGILDK